MSIQRVINVVPTTPGLPWNCLNCGECCERVSISKQEYKLILNKIPPTAQEIFKQATIAHPRNPKYVLIEGKCPFFKKNHCLIYKIRPFACRYFVCGRKTMDEPLVFAKDKCLNSILRRKIDPYFRDQVAQSTYEAKEWGIHYGWPRRNYKHEDSVTLREKI